MAAKVYTFHISYEGLEEKIWRDIEVSSNYRLDQLGYVILAAFDTLAYHLFHFSYKGSILALPSDEDMRGKVNVGTITLYQMSLNPGDRLSMTYDYGTEQIFRLELTDVRDMGRGQGRRYPQITAGAGMGIIDDMYWEELKELIEQIDRNGKTDEPIYYHDRRIPWDYRRFDMEYWHVMLKGITEGIEEGYALFWE